MDAGLIAALKAHARTGIYARHHLRMSAATFDRLKAETPQRAATPYHVPVFGGPSMLEQLLAIPVVYDDTLGPGDWQLAANSGHRIARYGNLDDPPPLDEGD